MNVRIELFGLGEKRAEPPLENLLRDGAKLGMNLGEAAGNGGLPDHRRGNLARDGGAFGVDFGAFHAPWRRGLAFCRLRPFLPASPLGLVDGGLFGVDRRKLRFGLLARAVDGAELLRFGEETVAALGEVVVGRIGAEEGDESGHGAYWRSNRRRSTRYSAKTKLNRFNKNEHHQHLSAPLNSIGGRSTVSS